MSGPHPDRPFSETEKVVLLAEIIKWSEIPSGALHQLIEQYQVEPAWSEITRPPGRTLTSCQKALREMPAVQAPPSQVFNYDASSYPARQPYVEPIQPIPGRSIIPRPQGMEHGSYPASLSPYAQSPSSAEPPRKRGRPSNADIQKRRDLAAARGEVYNPAPSRPRKPKTARTSATPSEITTAVGVSESRRTSGGGQTASPPNIGLPPSVPRALSSPALSHVSHSSKRVRSPDVEAQERRIPRGDGAEPARAAEASSRGPRWPSAATAPSPWANPPTNRPSTPATSNVPQSAPTSIPHDSTITGLTPVPPHSRGEPIRSPLRETERHRSERR